MWIRSSKDVWAKDVDLGIIVYCYHYIVEAEGMNDTL